MVAEYSRYVSTRGCTCLIKAPLSRVMWDSESYGSHNINREID